MVRVVIALGFMAWVTSASASDQPTKTLPPVPGKSLPVSDASKTKVKLRIGGGIFPPNYFVSLDGDRLIYTVKGYDYATNKELVRTREFRPSPQQWEAFWKSMDEVDVWNWKPSYEHKRLADGTHWSVELAHNGRTIRSQGRILFPGKESQSLETEYTDDRGPIFEKYLEAVRKLIGDEAFR